MKNPYCTYSLLSRVTLTSFSSFLVVLLSFFCGSILTSTAVHAQSWPGDDFPLTPYFRTFKDLSKKQRKHLLQLWRKGRVTRAIQSYKRDIHTLRPASRTRALLELAHQLMSFADAKRALPIYKHVLKSKNKRRMYTARLFLARFELQQFRPRHAFRYMRTWPRQKPKYVTQQIWLAGWLLRGLAATELHRYTTAQKSFDVLIRSRLLADIGRYLKIKSLVRQKRYTHVLREAKDMLKKHPASRFSSRVQVLRARTFERMKKYRRALTVYRSLQRGKKRNSRAQLGIIRCLLRLQKRQQARSALLRMIRTYPGRWTAQSAFRMLQKLPSKRYSPSTRYSLAYHSYRRGRFKDAAHKLKRLIQELRKQKKTNKRVLASSVYLLGRVHFRLKHYTPSRKALRTYLRLFPRGKKRLAAQLLRIRSQYRKRKDLPTVREYASFAERYKRTSLGRKALWWAAQLYFEHGQTRQATQLFTRYTQRYPRSRRSVEARIKMALVAYKKKQYKRVIQRLRPLTRWGGRTGARALFWTAKAYEKQKKMQRAWVYFRKIKPFSDAYYAARARIRTEKRSTVARTPIALYRLLSDAREERNHRRSMKKWYDRYYRSIPLSKRIQIFKRKRAYRRAYIFALAGANHSLRAEINALRRQIKNPIEYYFLARMWNAFGDPNRTLYTAGLFRRKVPRSKRKGLPFKALMRLLYPIPFPGAYASNALRYKVPALLMVGLTRQESLFNPRIVSHANAHGIAQIMPKEGKKMAKKWGIRGFKVRHLFRPQLNLRMGFFHFRAYLNRHAQDIPLTLAAYNAGPGALKRWLRENPQLPKKDLEAFIEYGIGYRETRMYVRYCLRWYNTYRFAFAPDAQ